MPGLKLRKGCHREETLAWILVQLFETEMRQNPVLAGHGHEVGCNAHDQEVKEGDKRLERNSVFLGICLDKLETDSTT